MPKRYKENSGQIFPCYECEYNTFDNENCIGCINDKGTVFHNWKKSKIEEVLKDENNL